MEKKTDLRIIKTQNALCDTFLVMLGEKKFEDITVNELCERAMVRRATFYKHFADKYEFFGFFIRQIQDRFTADLVALPPNDEPYSYYSYLFGECIRFLDQHRQLLDGVIKSNTFHALLDIFSDEIYRNVLLTLNEDVKGGMSFPVSTEILASFYTGGIIHTLRFWITNPKQRTKQELIQEVDAILRCLEPLPC